MSVNEQILDIQEQLEKIEEQEPYRVSEFWEKVIQLETVEDNFIKYCETDFSKTNCELEQYNNEFVRLAVWIDCMIDRLYDIMKQTQICYEYRIDMTQRAKYWLGVKKFGDKLFSFAEYLQEKIGDKINDGDGKYLKNVKIKRRKFNKGIEEKIRTAKDNALAMSTIYKTTSIKDKKKIRKIRKSVYKK